MFNYFDIDIYKKHENELKNHRFDILENNKLISIETRIYMYKNDYPNFSESSRVIFLLYDNIKDKVEFINEYVKQPNIDIDVIKFFREFLFLKKSNLIHLLKSNIKKNFLLELKNEIEFYNFFPEILSKIELDDEILNKYGKKYKKHYKTIKNFSSLSLEFIKKYIKNINLQKLVSTKEIDKELFDIVITNQSIIQNNYKDFHNYKKFINVINLKDIINSRYYFSDFNREEVEALIYLFKKFDQTHVNEIIGINNKVVQLYYHVLFNIVHYNINNTKIRIFHFIHFFYSESDDIKDNYYKDFQNFYIYYPSTINYKRDLSHFVNLDIKHFNEIIKMRIDNNIKTVIDDEMFIKVDKQLLKFIDLDVSCSQENKLIHKILKNET